LGAWLAARPLWWRSGNLIAVHALTDPAAPMEAQDDETLIWARPGRAFAPRADGAWVVHGHTVVPEPRVQAGHVAVDTGAYRTGRLTAAVFTPAGDAPRFLQVTDAPA
jgi:serine/threonine protein phosphatase 1